MPIRLANRCPQYILFSGFGTMPPKQLTDIGIEDTLTHMGSDQELRRLVVSDGPLWFPGLAVQQITTLSQLVPAPELHDKVGFVGLSDVHRYPTILSYEWCHVIQFQSQPPRVPGEQRPGVIAMSADVDLDGLSLVAAHLAAGQGRALRVDELAFAPSATPAFRRHVEISWQALATSPDHAPDFLRRPAPVTPLRPRIA